MEDTREYKAVLLVEKYYDKLDKTLDLYHARKVKLARELAVIAIEEMIEFHSVYTSETNNTMIEYLNKMKESIIKM